jgi:hypothetical protein
MSSAEVLPCMWWLKLEEARVQQKLILYTYPSSPSDNFSNFIQCMQEVVAD